MYFFAHYKNTGDKLLERYFMGMKMVSTSFLVLPVYFDTTILVDNEQDRQKLEEKINHTVRKYIFGGRIMISRIFFVFLPFLLQFLLFSIFVCKYTLKIF